jgi:hypothetical protein
MSLLRFLNVQGIAGIAASVALALLLLMQKSETRHWKRSNARFEQLYSNEHSAFAQTVANYRAAADSARAADQANLTRVAAEQRAIDERTSDDFEARLAAARSLAQRLRKQSAGSAADSRAGEATPVPRLPAPADGAAETSGKDGLPQPDALIATEQAIQLDELIKWVRQQHAVRVDDMSGEPPSGRGAQAPLRPAIQP